jgi:hypothetical protein
MELDTTLSPAVKKELKRRIADAENPVRYVVFSDIGGYGSWRLWLDVSGDGFWDTIENATLFKRERVARAVALAYSEGRTRDLLVAKITTKNGKRRVLKYEKQKHRKERVRRSPFRLVSGDGRRHGAAP